MSDKWQTDEGGLELRELDDIVLDDVSILTKKPAYIATSVEVRSTDEGSDSPDSMKEVRCVEEQAEVTDDSHALDMVKIELELLLFGGMNE